MPPASLYDTMIHTQGQTLMKCVFMRLYVYLTLSLELLCGK